MDPRLQLRKQVIRSIFGDDPSQQYYFFSVSRAGICIETKYALLFSLTFHTIMIGNTEIAFTNANASCLKDIVPCQPERRRSLVFASTNHMEDTECRNSQPFQLKKKHQDRQRVTGKLLEKIDHDVIYASATGRSIDRFDAIFSPSENSKVDTLLRTERKQQSRSYLDNPSNMKRRKGSSTGTRNGGIRTFLPTIEETLFEEDEVHQVDWIRSPLCRGISRFDDIFSTPLNTNLDALFPMDRKQLPDINQSKDLRQMTRLWRSRSCPHKLTSKAA